MNRGYFCSFSQYCQIQKLCNFLQVHYADAEKLRVYDPIFILHFSVHCLSMGFVEPLEFASLGLLAITVVSISSPDDDMRKLGYEVLGRFKSLLEVYIIVITFRS